MAASKPASADKPYLRDFFIEQRKALCEDMGRKNALDLEIQTRLLITPEYRAADTILLYMARPTEIATCIDSLNDLAPGRFGILEPTAQCEEIIPDEHTLCICPALCCDMRGYRLGFGGGYYDRYLADFPGVKAALCYADSMIPKIGEEPFDIKMDVILTDSFTRYMK